MVEASAAYQIILIIAGGIIAARLGQKLRVPEAIPLLVAGYILGADVLGFLKLQAFGISLDFIALFAVPVILFYDGLRTDSRHLLEIWKSVLSMTTLAVLVTVAGIAFVSHLFLGLSWLASLLLGAVLSSTDPAGIIPVVRKLNIRKRVSTMLEAEAALNDATSIIIFTIILGVALGESVSVQEGVARFLYSVLASSFIGAVVGIVVAQGISAIRAFRDVTFASFIVILAAYGISEAIGSSGVLAALMAALVFRYFLQSRMVDALSRLSTQLVWEHLNFLAIALVFLALGSQLQLSILFPYAVVGIFIALAFLLVVRPITVLASLFFDHSFSLNEKLLIAWLGGPRGTVSAALASIILAKASTGLFSVSEANAIFSITITVIVATVVITGATASFAVRKLLGLREDSVESQYRRLSTELKAMMVASRKLREEWKAGVVSTKMYEEIDGEHKKRMLDIERELYGIAKSAPALENKARSTKVQEVLFTQISALEDAYENKELLEGDYEELTKKFLDQIQRLDEIESSAPVEEKNDEKSAEEKEKRVTTKSKRKNKERKKK